MGLEGPTDHAVQEVGVGPVEGEALAVDALVDAALQGRPELAASEHQLRAQELQISSTRGGYWPRFSASVSGSQAGADPTKLQWGLNGQVGLSWPLFEGGITRAQVREQQANLNGIQAQRDALRQQVRLEVERAQLAINAARSSCPTRSSPPPTRPSNGSRRRTTWPPRARSWRAPWAGRWAPPGEQSSRFLMVCLY